MDVSIKTRLNSNSNFITKYERFQYQQILDTFNQNVFFSDFNSGSILLFNKIFSENKNIKAELVKKTNITKRLCSKQFINILAERNFKSKTNLAKKANLFKYSTPRFKSINTKSYFNIPFTSTY